LIKSGSKDICNITLDFCSFELSIHQRLLIVV